MAQYFSPLIDKYLLAWIGISTWSTLHPADIRRFYKFIKALKRYSRKEKFSELGSTIMRASNDLHLSLPNKTKRKIIDDYISLAHIGLEYCETPFPDPLIEMRNPHEVALRLGLLQKFDKEDGWVPLYSIDDIEELVNQNFGEGWQKDPRWSSLR